MTSAFGKSSTSTSVPSKSSLLIRTETQTFCKNEYNLTGFCSKPACPLANSNYATVREKKGKLYLCSKTIERAHLPSKLWEITPLDQNYAKVR